ncbi:unnamed protein product [Rhodiola kirilowii]
MGTVQLQGPVIFQTAVSAKQGVCIFPSVSNLVVAGTTGVAAWGLKRRGLRNKLKVFNRPHLRKFTNPRCSLSPSSDGNGSMAGKFKENDEDYVNSSVVDAVEVKSGDGDGFVVRMRDGSHLQCVHNNPQGGGCVLEYAPHPAIVLKMEDGTDLLLPIIVLEMPSVLLMAAVHNIQIARPTIYQVIREMVGKMGYEVKLVRITKRVREAYFAKLYLAELGNEDECISFDLRPSDAINIAVRCKVPIQVNRSLVCSDGMKVIDSRVPMHSPASDGTLLVTELDRPNNLTRTETKEFNLLQNMFTAAYEERYKDAAQWRDKLTHFRSQKNGI